MSGHGRIAFVLHLVVHLVSVSLSAVRPSDVRLMASNMYLRPLREHSPPGRPQGVTLRRAETRD